MNGMVATRLLAGLATALATLGTMPAVCDAATPALIEALRADLEEDPAAPVLGNPEGDIVVVEFLDYNCALCRAEEGVVEDLLASDRAVRLVIREWPTDGPDSEAAARAALAVRAQGVDAFRALHETMLRLQAPATARPALVLAQVLGLDDSLLKSDMEAPSVAEHLVVSQRLAAELGLIAPPAFVIGDHLLQGPVSAEALRAAVAAARAAR